MIADPLRFLAVPLDSLHLDPANARLHGEKNLETIKSSLAQFGQRKPIVVQKDGMIVRAGNGTVRAARALGWTEIAAVIVDDDNATAAQYAIADNRAAELAAWDDEVLASLLQGMDEQSRQAIGFDEDDLAALLKSLTPQEPTGDPDQMLGAIQYSVVVDVHGEKAQADLLERLEKEGYTCRALMS
jgi:ParB-like chromosome segregation protein Spo0J